MTVDIEKLKALCDAATPGPWATRAERNCPRAIVTAGTEQIADASEHTHWTDAQCESNASFIAVARVALPAALDEIERLRECLAKANANHEHFERQWYLVQDERDEAIRQRNESFRVGQMVIDSMRAERDAAVARVDEIAETVDLVDERIREAIAQPGTKTLGWRCGWCGTVVGTVADGDCGVEAGKQHSVTCAANPAVQERDAARAEVEHLRKERDEALIAHHGYLATIEMQGSRIQEYAAHVAKHFPARGSELGDLTVTEERLHDLADGISKIKLDLSDPETREVWEAAQEAKREVESWPAWKRGVAERERGDFHKANTAAEIARGERLERERDSALAECSLLRRQRDELAAAVEAANRDASRYRRLRVLGCAPVDTRQLANGTVLCFTNLDAHVDRDMELHPSRGEARDV